MHNETSEAPVGDDDTDDALKHVVLIVALIAMEDL